MMKTLLFVSILAFAVASASADQSASPVQNGAATGSTAPAPKKAAKHHSKKKAAKTTDATTTK